jgi:diguanylate cyclase (GGDEF)-like protein
LTFSTPHAHASLTPDEDPARATARLVAARSRYYERPVDSLAVATAVHEYARARGEHALCARAKALQGMVSLHRGDLRGALGLVVQAERNAAGTGDDAAGAEVAALKAQVSFFTGSYGPALNEAKRAIALADRAGDLRLRIHARRTTCLVFGNLAVPDLRERVETLLALTLQAGDSWEEAISRNDLAANLAERGEIDSAEAEIEQAVTAALAVEGPNSFALAIVHSTRADIRLQAGRPAEALADAEAALTHLARDGEPDPYVLAATVRAEVQARMTLGQLERARQSGEGALEWLGERVPQMRSFILATLAAELRAAGRVDDAYDALARSAELERQAFAELSELQRSLERATLETDAARRESDSLAAKNRELARMHAELADRTAQLESLQEQLREQADRDWLTGLHNRRYLARELEATASGRLALPLALAVLDVDRFKQINDRFGHDAGDRVLVRVARLLSDALREHDIVVRSGGEEFLLVMPSTDHNAAVAGCERIRQTIEREDWTGVVDGITVTASIGLAVADEAGNVQRVAKLADERLYAAKRLGRNRVVADEPAAPERVT